MKKNVFYYVVAALGILLFGTGIFLLKSLLDPQGILLVLPYICIGLGCGAFGHGMGGVISLRVQKSNPSIQKQIEIDKNDERNIAISNRAKARAYDMMIFVFAALLISFALMGVDLIVILLMVFSYLLIIGYAIYCYSKYNKEM